MQTLLIILDGLCEASQAELGGCSPLDLAHTPAMDSIVRHSRLMRVVTCPEGMSPATDCCVMTMLGYDVTDDMPGRGVIEATGFGLEIPERATVYRCNIAPVKDGIIEGAANLIDTRDISRLERLIADRGGHFRYTGHGHGLLIMPNDDTHNGRQRSSARIEAHGTNSLAGTLPMPNSLIGMTVPTYHPAPLDKIVSSSLALLKDSVVIPWGAGEAHSVTPLWEHCTMITGVNVMKGIGRLSGMKVIENDRFTGDTHSDLRLKAATAIEAIESGSELVVVHVEAPDAVSHLTHSGLQKAKAIEVIDTQLVAPLLAELPDDCRLILSTDHYSDSVNGLHHADPVPLAIMNPDSAPHPSPLKMSERIFAPLPVSRFPALR